MIIMIKILKCSLITFIKELNLHIIENIYLVINFDNLVYLLNMCKDNLNKTLIASYIKKF